MSASDGRTGREMSTTLNNAMAEAGAKPLARIRIDANKVVEAANAVNVALFPALQLSPDRDQEEITQQVALVMVVESRFREMNISREGRAHMLQAAIAVMNTAGRREIHDLRALEEDATSVEARKQARIEAEVEDDRRRDSRNQFHSGAAPVPGRACRRCGGWVDHALESERCICKGHFHPTWEKDQPCAVCDSETKG